MRQRVSVARALAMDPQILLLDEPLSALDALTRATLQDEIERIWEDDKKTVVLITNDVDEALLLADRIIPLTPGPGATLGASVRRHPRAPARPQGAQSRSRVQAAPRPRHRTSSSATASDADATVTRKLTLPDILPEDLDAPAHHPRQRVRCARDGARRRQRRHRPAPSDSIVMSSFLEISQLGKIYPTRRKARPSSSRTSTSRSAEGRIRHAHRPLRAAANPPCSRWSPGSPTSRRGGVILAGKEVVGAGPDRGVVFQSPCLLPWLTAFENVMLGVDQVYLHRRSPRSAGRSPSTTSRVVGLADAMHKKPAELSQGMRQRCGIARAFALSPKMLLLDEPFGMLDSLTRYELQEVLLDLWQKDQKTALMVTHDVDEALFLSDRVVMMTNGPAATVGEILEVKFPRPRSRKQLLEDPDYYRLREQLIGFLEERSHLRPPDRARRRLRSAASRTAAAPKRSASDAFFARSPRPEPFSANLSHATPEHHRHDHEHARVLRRFAALASAALPRPLPPNTRRRRPRDRFPASPTSGFAPPIPT